MSRWGGWGAITCSGVWEGSNLSVGGVAEFLQFAPANICRPKGHVRETDPLQRQKLPFGNKICFPVLQRQNICSLALASVDSSTAL